MKKQLVVLLSITLALVLLTTVVSAKGLTGKGIKLGLNLANFGGSDADIMDGKKMRMGLAGGGFITYSFSDMWAIQPEILYTMKGAKYEGTEVIPISATQSVNADYKVTIKMDYLEIPVLLKLMIPSQSGFKPCLMAGPALGIKMSSKEKAEVTVLGVSASTETDMTDVKSTDFGLVFGAGFGYEVGGGAITFDARYELGMSTIDNSSNAGDIKNNAISFFVGYSF